MKEWTETELNLAIQWKRTFCLYLYTPMCGTCMVASKMMNVSLELLQELECGKMNLNFMQKIAHQYEVESVPCLMLFKNGTLTKKIYAFQSVPYLYEELKTLNA